MRKPPLGVMPRELWEHQRRTTVSDAIRRYMEASMSIPSEWTREVQGGVGLKYIVIIVDTLDDTHEPIIIDNVKIEYVAVGQQFVGRHFRGQRPTHVIDRSKVRKWIDHMEDMTAQAVWVNEEAE